MKTLKTEKDIQKYIKHMFGIDVKITLKHHFWAGCEGKCFYCNSRIEMKRDLTENPMFLRYVLWHEVGHMFTAKDRDPRYINIRNETNAQIWALKNLKERGFTKLFFFSLEQVKNNGGWNRYSYRRAKQKILEKVNRNDYRLI